MKIDIEKTQNGILILKTYINNEPYKCRYIGYNLRTARKLFKNFLKNLK